MYCSTQYTKNKRILGEHEAQRIWCSGKQVRAEKEAALVSGVVFEKESQDW
jgi:hypothetical protein